MTASPAPRLTRGTHVGYAMGSIGTAAFGTVPGLLLLYYLTDVLGVAAGIAGAGGVRAQGVGRPAQPRGSAAAPTAR